MPHRTLMTGNDALGLFRGFTARASEIGPNEEVVKGAAPMSAIRTMGVLLSSSSSSEFFLK